MTQLTLERLFGSPDLNGSVPGNIKLSPTGDSITFLQSSTDDAHTLHLWQHHLATGESTLLVDANELSLRAKTLSDEEKARRERKRISHAGIVEHIVSPDGRSMAFPLDGNLYLYHFDAESPLQQLTDDTTFETDIKFSPDGRYLSFIRDKNLYLFDLDTWAPVPLTADGGGDIANGLAEFIAQEEMHRFDGYWWSPDSRHIAYLQTDESPVQKSQRFEIDAESFSVFDQRYPFTGTNNAIVKLGVISVDDKATRWIDLDRDTDSYIARVNWLANSQELAVQIQSRNQQSLELRLCVIDTQVQTPVLTETSDTWINLHDIFWCLEDSTQFIWGSERTGYRHLYLVGRDGTIERQLTDGKWMVSEIHSVDEQSGQVYFSGYYDSPLECHLYTVDLHNPGEPRRLTSPGASHQVGLDRTSTHFIDRHSGVDQPPGVTIRQINGKMSGELAANRIEKGHPFYPYRNSRGTVHFGELTAEDGQTLYYRLIEPVNRQAGAKYPVIVTVYGGPGVQRVTHEWIPPWHHYMASRGYGLFQLDNRGSSNRGKPFEDPIHGQLGKVEIADQLVGTQFLERLDWVDSSAIGIFGHSYGGYMTLMLMAKAPGRFQAGVSVAPVSDWRLYDTHYTERYLGNPEVNHDAYENSAVFKYLDQLEDKLLIIHGMADDNVLFTHSTRLFKHLQDANMPFDMMTYPGAKHGLSGQAINLHRFGTMDRFFDQHLKGKQT
ncbi:MAG: alpha/beta fold hydrolase [Pseudomonadales bacterium]